MAEYRVRTFVPLRAFGGLLVAALIGYAPCLGVAALGMIGLQGLGTVSARSLFTEWAGGLSLIYVPVWSLAGLFASLIARPRKLWVPVAAFAAGGLLSAIGVGLYVAGALTRNDLAAGTGVVLALGSPICLGGVFLLRDMEKDVEFPKLNLS